MKSINARAWFKLPPCLTRGKYQPAIIVEAPDGVQVVAVGRYRPPVRRQEAGKGGARR
jgi:hypothetical protein